MSQLELIVEVDEEQLTLLIEDAVQHLEDISAEAGNILQREVDGLYVPDTSIDKVDKEVGKSLVDDLEIAKLLYIEAEATKNDTDESLRDRGTHTGTQPINTVEGLTDALVSKVDKAAGKGLSDTNFTQAEKDKLSYLESSKFVGLFVSESALPLSGSEGDYANVDGGVGSDVYRVIWDSSDNKWVRAQGVSTELTDAQIKQQYESNPDTNAFTDDEKAKLASVTNGATANRADILNADKVHTHVINDVTGLSTRLGDIDALIGDVESVLVAINGEP